VRGRQFLQGIPTSGSIADKNTVSFAAATRLTVILADPDAHARGAVKELLRADGRFVVIAEAVDGVEAAELAVHYRPDLLLVELSLPRLDTPEVAQRVRARSPATRVVVLTAIEDDEAALSVLRAGASSILARGQGGDALGGALINVHHGEAMVPPRVMTRLVQSLRSTGEQGRGVRPVRSSLSSREWEVLDLLIAGASTTDIAATLVLTEDTVYSHVKSILRKLGVRSRVDAIAAARRLLRVTGPDDGEPGAAAGPA
jgi:NarL family two-component system response regulator LiaR